MASGNVVDESDMLIYEADDADDGNLAAAIALSLQFARKCTCYSCDEINNPHREKCKCCGASHFTDMNAQILSGSVNARQHRSRSPPATASRFAAESPPRQEQFSTRRRFKLASRVASELIALRGKTLNDIRFATGASISLTQNEIERGWRLMTVSGCSASVGHAMRLVEDKVGCEEFIKLEVLCESHLAKHHPSQKIFDVPAALAGQLIGRRGLHLDSIKQLTSASISFGSEASHGHRILTMSGDQTQIRHAVQPISIQGPGFR